MPIEATGIEELAARIDAIADRAEDLRPVLRGEAKRLEELVSAAWAAEVSPGGQAWPPKRAPRLRRTTRRVRPPRSLARRTGSGSSGRLESAHEATAGRNVLRLRVPVPYASFQFFGTDEIPARNALPVIRRGGRQTWARTGAAGRFLEELAARVAAYIATGRRGR